MQASAASASATACCVVILQLKLLCRVFISSSTLVNKPNPFSSDQMDSDDDLQMTFFKKKKKNHDAVNNFNDNVGKKVQHQSDQPKRIHSKVHKKKDRKNLLAFMCKDCQEYYATRDLKEEELEKLIQDCSRHRAHDLPYRSPDRFWDIDFPDSQEKKKTEEAKESTSKTKSKTKRAKLFDN